MSVILFFVPNHLHGLIYLDVHIFVALEEPVNLTLEMASFGSQVVADLQLLI